MKGWTLYTSTTGKEYAKFGNKTYKCCRKNAPVIPGTWMWVGAIHRYVSTIPY